MVLTIDILQIKPEREALRLPNMHLQIFQDCYRRLGTKWG